MHRRRPPVEQNQQQQQKRHQFKLFYAKIDQMEQELEEMNDQLKADMALRARLGMEIGGRRQLAQNGAKNGVTLLKERIRANVAEMERHHQTVQQNQRKIGDKFFEANKLLNFWRRAHRKAYGGKGFPSNSLSAPAVNDSLAQQNLKPPILAIDLFHFIRFRNGNSTAQCMECGQKFAPTDEPMMAWHIVKEHNQYAPKLLQKQLDFDKETMVDRQQQQTHMLMAQRRKRKVTTPEWGSSG